MILRVKKLGEYATLPTRSHSQDAGLDLYSAETASLKPGQRKAFNTQIALDIPAGYVGLVWPRSGLAVRGLDIMGGVIDSGYTGEIRVVVINHNNINTIDISVGDRIAQLLVQKVELLSVEEVEDFGPTERGDNGFGSTDNSEKSWFYGDKRYIVDNEFKFKE